MKKFKRVFLTVLDSLGIGALPDAELFGDAGANTLRGISSSDKFNIPNLLSLGLGSIDGVSLEGAVRSPRASYGRFAEISRGKDTTVGHWELMGVVSDKPLPTYPEGFPPEIISEFEKRTGVGTLCNRPYSGTEVIRDFGREHIETGKLIVYTSADSVFQIAACESVVPPSKLYEYCKTARELLVGEHGVGRVIARPFTIAQDGSFTRTANRRDFSLEPPKKTVLDKLSESGLEVISIGKIYDIFAARGITEAIKTKSNDEGIFRTIEVLERDFSGLCFTNLVDFDMLFGHRQDKDGYAAALSRFDEALPDILSLVTEDDVFIITADHGCDPTDDSTDHTREYVPLLVFSPAIEPKGLGTLESFSAVGELVCTLLGVEG